MKKCLLLICATTLGAALALPVAAQTAVPQSCRNAGLLEEAQKTELAESMFELCVREAADNRDAIIYGRYHRAGLLAQMNRPQEALAEFEALLQPEFAQSPVYDRRSNGAEMIGGTRAVIAAQAGRLALGLQQVDKALTYAELALSEGARAPSVHLDVLNTAYMLRARIRAAHNDSPRATIDLIRAYIRGSQDEWVLSNITGLPAADFERVKVLAGRMTGAYADYISLYARSANIKMDSLLVPAKAKGDAAYQAVLVDETAYLGPDA